MPAKDLLNLWTTSGTIVKIAKDCYVAKVAGASGDEEEDDDDEGEPEPPLFCVNGFYPALKAAYAWPGGISLVGPGRAYSLKKFNASSPTLIFRGGASRPRRGCHVDSPRRRFAAPPRVPRGYSVALAPTPRPGKNDRRRSSSLSRSTFAGTRRRRP